MSDRNDFDFEDDFLSDDNEPFNFDDEEGFPSGLGDEFESDMPVIDEEVEERGPNRTFVALAGIMIILFVAALAVVLFLATRTTGPTDLELTASWVVVQNMTVMAQGAETSTQNAGDLFLTQTALAWSPTPSPTLQPTETEQRATITPTPSPNLTELAILQLANGALTLTALASQPTATPLPTDVPPPVAELDLQSAFATQVAFATQQGQFDQDAFSTRVAVATQVANASIDTAGELALRQQLDATQSSLDFQFGAVQTAIAFVDNELQVRSVDNPALATQLAIVIPAGLQTQAALGTPFAQATIAAIQTQSALGTLSADLNNQSGSTFPNAPSNAKLNEHDPSRADLATEVAMLPVQQDQNQTATAIVVETQAGLVTQVAQATRGALATQAALATQQAFLTPRAFATQAAIATQVALATRQALIDQALGLITTPTPGGGGGLEAVNQTATAIAAAFLTATAQAFTPQAQTVTALPPTPSFGQPATALPQTGLFEDVVSGGRDGIGVLALAVFGLVGVIVVSRRLRTTNTQADEQDQSSDPPKQE